MTKKLSIIIPRYKETEKEIFPLLSSINNQLGVDLSQVEVIISDDAYEIPLKDIPYRNELKYDVRIIRSEVNGGPGVARQVGLDASTSEFVMFCDADDILHSVASLSLLLSTMQDFPECKYTSSAWLEEIFFENKWSYVQHDVENTWMHGKIFRRQFLIDNDIRFHPDLRVHEDSYFLDIAAAYAGERRFVTHPTYVWKWGNDTITRRNEGEYAYTSFATFIHAITLSTNEIFKRGLGDKRYKVVQMLIYVYLQLETWKHIDRGIDLSSYIEDCEKELVKYMNDKWDIWNEAPYEYVNQVYNEEVKKNNSSLIENTPLLKWVADFKEKYKNFWTTKDN